MDLPLERHVRLDSGLLIRLVLRALSRSLLAKRLYLVIAIRKRYCCCFMLSLAHIKLVFGAEQCALQCKNLDSELQGIVTARS